MELPKNITQIGEVNQSCKIYVEDYVISYIRQINGCASDKEISIALYGIRKEEAGISYLFVYGASKLVFLSSGTRHLSQATMQEIEKIRKKYFGEYVFLGYQSLNGEMVEGFHIYSQGCGKYIEGYARFYEKNDSMLQFMLEVRQEEAKPEEFDQEKYNTVKQRQEERRASHSAGKEKYVRGRAREGRTGREKAERERTGRERPAVEETVGIGGMRKMKYTAAVLLGLVCIAGYATMSGGEKLGRLQVAARQMLDELSSRKLPETMEVAGSSVQVGSVVAEDKLHEAILRENEIPGQTESQVSQQLPDETLPVDEGGSGNGLNSPDADQPSDETKPGDTTQSPANTPSGTETRTSDESLPQNESQDSGGSRTQGENQASGGSHTQDENQTSGGSQTSGETAPTAGEGTTLETETYIVKKGDTLIGICLSRYGTDKMVARLCELNGIKNPDDIKVGEKILLPLL